MTASGLVRKLSRLVNTLRRRTVEAPLTVARLWSHPGAPCDQRRQVLAGMTEPLHVALGGNRSGKTYGAYQADIAFALGRDHPHVQAWCVLNDIDPKLIPLGPGEVVIASPTASQSRSQSRPAIDALLPPGVEWYGRNGLQEAYVKITCPGYHRQAVIWFKSVDQGPKSYKGSEARRYHIDEEPHGRDGELVLEECLRGASSVGGKVVITATPQDGYTWMMERLVDGGEHGATHSRINSLHNRFVKDYAALVHWLESMDPEQRMMREQGIWVDRRGRIYTGWDRGTHYRQSIVVDGQTITADSVPRTWRRYRGIDFGQTAPTAIVWAAVDPRSGLIVVYRCAQQPGVPYPEWADRIRAVEGAVRGEDGVWRGATEQVEACWGDPSDPGAIEDLCAHDVPTHKAYRQVDAGISDVRDAMRLDVKGTPGLVVLHGDGTADLVRDVEGYRYDPAVKIPRPLKKDDHLADALRYVVRGIRQLEGQRRAKLAPTEEPES